MSSAPSPVPVPQATQDATMTDAGMQSRKSYRRKYRKIMVAFEQRVQESNGLFKDEQRIFDISQRLAEQTDQILEMLLELNGRPQIPKRLRYDLTPASSVTHYSADGQYSDEHLTHELLRASRNQVQKGEISSYDHEEVQAKITNSIDFKPSRSYASVTRRTAQSLSNVESIFTPDSPGVGMLTVRQEEQYLQSLDDFLNGKNTFTRAHAAKSLGSRNAEKTTDREREIQLKNPVSAYNWLRKHQPQVFLQDHEPAGDKSKSSGSRSSKRTAPSKETKPDHDYYDEDGIALDQTGSIKGKRKRGDDDTAFRPKGGRSSHPGKRRKEDSGEKRSKRLSVDARNS